ncbi:MAG: hypothetical protein DHS20C18_21720 [Saprospiraceae bacterium]|nr:MAG: hypothetical protein DHS20C18_21720 [Saprospiraceae bacterium]
MLDGLDEVSQETQLDEIISQIRDFSEKYSSNHFLISCRVAAYDHWFEQYTDLEISDFNEKQIETFVQNWFVKEPNMAKECLAQVKERPQLRELSSMPLLLTLLCITYEADEDFPAYRADLYDRSTEALLKKWDASRRITRHNPYKELSIRKKRKMFAHLAYSTFKDNRYLFRKANLSKMIEDFLISQHAIEERDSEVDGEEILESIEANHSIFVERARGLYSFGHLTFQEYFTANFIVDNAASGTIEKLVDDHLYNYKWREVFLLAMGRLSDASEMLLRMVQKNRMQLRETRLNRLLKGLDEVLRPDKNSYPNAFRKSIVLYDIFSRVGEYAYKRILNSRPEIGFNLNTANDRNFALDLALSFTELRDLVRISEFDGTRTLNNIPELGLKLDNYQFSGLVDELKSAWDLDFESVREGDTLFLFTLATTQFLKGNLLIVECLNADAYVSEEVQGRILDGLLEPEWDKE